MTRGGEPVLRPVRGLKALKAKLVPAVIPRLAAFFRVVWPIPRFGSLHIVTRHDDVRETMFADRAFMVPYAEKLAVLLSDVPIFVGMADTEEYRSQLARLEAITEKDDCERLAANAEARAEEIVVAANGRLEVVDGLFRTVSFAVLMEYLGIPTPENGDFRVWSTRMFEYLFMASDKPLVADIGRFAPALRAHTDAEIARRRAGGAKGDDLLGRALRKQANGVAGWDDVFIRTVLNGLMFGGSPQPSLALPHVLEQLLRRPGALAGARSCAIMGDLATLLDFILEALRLDPIALILKRNVVADYTIATGTGRDHPVRKGDRLLVGIQSAMADGRRIPDPKRFDPRRQSYQYLHFGYGLHRCFAEQINHAIFPAMLAPLLRRGNLRRARGKAGNLAREGNFPAALTVEFD